MENITITINYTEVKPSEYKGFRIPLTHGTMYEEIYRDRGYTAELKDCNRLVLTHPYAVKEFVVSYELSGHDCRKMMERDDEANRRFWEAVEGVVMARLAKTIRHINRKTW